MRTTKYAIKEVKENMAKALSKDVGISTKTSIEIANFLRGKTTTKAKNILERVLMKTQAIPFKRGTDGVGHRKGSGIGPGRFPQNASEAFLKLIKSAEANAQAKGLSEDLVIVHLVAQKGSNQFRSGRQRRRKYKRTHIEIVVEEQEKKQKLTKKSESKLTEKTQPKKTQEKKVEKPVAEKLNAEVKPVPEKKVEEKK